MNSTTLEIDTPLLLEPAVQNYAWGKVGEESLVAQLLPDFSAQLPYAELWFGDHQRAPAKILAAGQRVALDQLISQYPVEILGSHLIAQFGAKLPFLFKVLSVKQSLSIQAHPDRQLARVLHAQNPANYPDDNHKPEIAIALSEMRLLYGFKTLKQIRALLSVTPELAVLVGDELVLELQKCHENEDREYLKKLLSKIIQTPQDQLSKYGALFVQRIKSLKDPSPEQELTLELAQLYGVGDVGIFSSCIMNFCELKPGEAVYIGPNIPHAYLSGDMIECMANSDNVVRAGLTPKFQDTETLISMLTYESGPLTPIRSESTSNAGLRVFATPTKEFALYEVIGINPLAIGSAGFPAIVFCLQGNAQVQAGGKTITISRGKAAIIPAFLDCRMVTLEQSSRAFLVTVPA